MRRSKGAGNVASLQGLVTGAPNGDAQGQNNNGQGCLTPTEQSKPRPSGVAMLTALRGIAADSATTMVQTGPALSSPPAACGLWRQVAKSDGRM